MIEATVSGIEDILSEFTQLLDVQAVERMVNRDIAPVVERRLDTVIATTPPPRDDTKFIWSLNRAANARARRWWFANLREGNIPTDGQHYLRSGVIPDSWQTEIAIDGDAVTLTIFNPAPGSERVYGSPEITQVPGHATTGWTNYTELLGFIDVVRSETITAWETLIINSTKAPRK